jgi:azurin
MSALITTEGPAPGTAPTCARHENELDHLRAEDKRLASNVHELRKDLQPLSLQMGILVSKIPDNLQGTLAGLATKDDLDEVKKGIEKTLEDKYVQKADFEVVRRIVFGVATAVGLAVVTAILAQVLK